MVFSEQRLDAKCVPPVTIIVGIRFLFLRRLPFREAKMDLPEVWQ